MSGTELHIINVNGFLNSINLQLKAEIGRMNKKKRNPDSANQSHLEKEQSWSYHVLRFQNILQSCTTKQHGGLGTKQIHSKHTDI